MNASCYPLTKIKHKSWFVLPPLMEYYYKKKNASYKVLPHYKKDCVKDKERIMAFIYPKQFSNIFLPKDFSGKTSDVVFRLAHNIPESKVYWYLNTSFIGTTTNLHEMAIHPKKSGKHTITVLDEFGNEIKKVIEITE